jgi:hypothetical protein
VLILAALVTPVVIAACGTTNAQTQPAARVNGHPIPMALYNREVVFKRVSSEADSGIDLCAPKIYAGLCHQMKVTVLNDLIGNELVREYAQRHGISVSTAEYQRQWSEVFSNRFHSDSAVLKAYARHTGLEVTDIKNEVRDNLLQQKVMYAVTTSMPTSGPQTLMSRIVVSSEAELKNVRAELARGVPFLVVAKQLALKKNSACSQVGCGQLGLLPNALLPATQKAVGTAKPGSVEGPYPTQTALTLLRVDAHYQKKTYTEQQVYSLRQQLFARWVAAQIRHASVQRYATT